MVWSVHCCSHKTKGFSGPPVTNVGASCSWFQTLALGCHWKPVRFGRFSHQQRFSYALEPSSFLMIGYDITIDQPYLWWTAWNMMEPISTIHRVENTNLFFIAWLVYSKKVDFNLRYEQICHAPPVYNRTKRTHPLQNSEPSQMSIFNMFLLRLKMVLKPIPRKCTKCCSFLLKGHWQKSWLSKQTS